MKDDVSGPAELETDARGRLFSRRVRTLMAAGGVPGEALPAVEACAALGRAGRLMHQAMERWAERQGLSETRLGVLLMLRHLGGDGVPLGTLAASLHVSPRNVTGLVDNLERDGLVTRVADPTDRRSVLARLTDSGRQRIDACWLEAVDRQQDLLEGFSGDELAQLRHLCLRIVKNMEET
ncbi:MAG TPA: MarR family transcriptional regulator [Candidatus Dormibacteraeota bacterium]|nr:MarR family transcriptional regulator [Candidatus Dormibacteraeota bacterium]